MTDQAIYLLIGLFFAIVIFSKLGKAKRNGGAYPIDDRASAKLGLAYVEPAARTPEDFTQEASLGGQLFARGHFSGYPATLLYFYDSGRRRGGRSAMGSRRVTLALELPSPSSLSFTIEPKLPLLLRRAAPKEPLVPTHDAAFDERFLVYSEEGREILGLLNPQLRSLLIALRREISPDLPDDGGGWKAAASGIAMGRIRLNGPYLSFTVNGSPDEDTAAKLQSSVVVLLAIANEVVQR